MKGEGDIVEPDVLRLRSEDLVWQAVDGDVVVLDLRGSQYLRLNRTAAVLWRLIVDSSTRAALVKALVAEFGIDQERAGEDVDAFLDRLRAKQLLEA